MALKYDLHPRICEFAYLKDHCILKLRNQFSPFFYFILAFYTAFEDFNGYLSMFHLQISLYNCLLI